MNASAPPILPPEFRPLLAASLLGVAPLGWVSAADVPAPFHELLVHRQDMTSRLASFHGDSISLKVLHSRQEGAIYFREVTLHAATTGTPVEYGLIEIFLEVFPAPLRQLILAEHLPFGTLLNQSNLAYRSEPQGFFTVSADPLIPIFPQSSSGEILFGRYNHLVSRENICLARIIEILPPAKC